MLKSLLLVAALLLACVCSRAQQAAPQIRIVDVMPAFDPDLPVDNPLFQVDFLVGAWPHPSWWGRPWRSSDGTGDIDLTDLNARLTTRSAKGIAPLGTVYGCSYIARWNEALGLYTVRARVLLQGKTWPKNAKLNFRGELPAPFASASVGGTLPFEVEFAELPKKGLPDVQLIAPRPSLWVKSVRVFPFVPNKYEKFSYEADVQLAGRRATLRHMVVSSGRFIDEKGECLACSGTAGGQYGTLPGSGFPDSFMANRDFGQSPLEFVLYGSGWSDGFAKAAANVFYQQHLEYGGREPLQITFPITRDGVPLEGEIPPSEWKLEAVAPASN